MLKELLALEKTKDDMAEEPISLGDNSAERNYDQHQIDKCIISSAA
jgi:hypothetical protein